MSEWLQKFQSLMAKMAITFFALGIIFSLIGSIVGMVGFPAILIQPMFYGFLMSLLGVVIFYTWKQYIPEIIEEFSGFMNSNEFTENREELDGEQAMTNDEDDSVDTASDDEIGNQSAAIGSNTRRSSHGVKVKGDELIVEGIAIKNEPKVMADAIKHLLDGDDE